MTNEQQKKRPKVTKVTVHVTYPDGTTGTITVDPDDAEALFWNEDSVLKILGSYYESKKPKHEMTKKELIARFGTIGKKVAKKIKDDKFKVNKKVIEDLWNEEDDKGISLTMLAKSIFCIPSPGGDG